jgi:SAM-dependent methyltransferase
LSRYGDVQRFYAAYDESTRLETGIFQLERERTRDVLARRLPAPPAVVLDVGGGPGAHARWLAGLGYEVHLVDVVPRHVEQARQTPAGERPLASASLGDARRLEQGESCCDAALLLGPLYHLPAREDRLAALREARRILRPGGVLAAAAISRFASFLDHLALGRDDPEFAAIVSRDIETGHHENTTDRCELFTDAFFHRPEELRREVEETGFEQVDLYALEGPATLARDFEDRWRAPHRRRQLLDWLRRLEREPSLLGASSHVLAVAVR